MLLGPDIYVGINCHILTFLSFIFTVRPDVGVVIPANQQLTTIPIFFIILIFFLKKKINTTTSRLCTCWMKSYCRIYKWRTWIRNMSIASSTDIRIWICISILTNTSYLHIIITRICKT